MVRPKWTCCPPDFSQPVRPKWTHQDQPATSRHLFCILHLLFPHLREKIGIVVPKSKEPTAFVTYGSIQMQVQLAGKLKTILSNYGKNGQGDDN